MAKTTNLFVNGPSSITEVLDDLARILLGRFEPLPESDEVFEFRNNDVVIDVDKHLLENDRDLRLEEFPFHIDIRATRIDAPLSPDHRRMQFAELIFNKLKETGKYDLMLVDDLQKKLAEFQR